MTQLTGSQRIGRSSALQVAAAVVGVVVIAAAGVSFGRWVIPADSSSDGAPSIGTAGTSAAATIVERHFEQRGSYGELAGAVAVIVPESGSVASTIAERHFEQRGGYGELAEAPSVVVPASSSAALAVSERHFEQRGPLSGTDVLSASAPADESAAAQIAERHFEQSGLETVR